MQCLFSNHKAKKNVNIKIPLRKKKLKKTLVHTQHVLKNVVLVQPAKAKRYMSMVSKIR